MDGVNHELASSRLYRWVPASYAVACYEKYMPVTIQGLGRLDQDLHIYDQQLLAQAGSHSHGEPDGSLSYHITLSYLWILGAYEVVRTIRQRIKEAGETDSALNNLLRKFERVRIPLAKFEAARNHQKTDASTAYPVLNSLYGIGWQVSRDDFITRGELSDAFLLWLESKRASEQGDS